MNFIFDPSLVLYLPLHELGGSSFMSKDAYGHLCTVTGALWRPYGRYFDGTDDYITVPDHAAFDITTTLSAMVWMRTPDYTVQHGVLVSKYLATGNKREWSLYQWNTGLVKVYFGDPNDGTLEAVEETDSQQILSDTWYLVGFTFGAGTVVIYVNGNTKASTTSSGTLPSSLYNSTADIVVANDGGGNSEFYGDIGEVWIYCRALTLPEMQQIYLATKWRYQ